MIEAEDHSPLHSKRKAITALLPYAVWQERDGRPEMLNTILRIAGITRWKFIWYHAVQFISTLLSEASPHAVMLVSPHIPWDRVTEGGLIKQWAASVAPRIEKSEEAVQGVVDALLQIASQDKIAQYIPDDLWSLLTKRPSLPPICLGRSTGTHPRVIEAVLALGNIEILKSYLLLVWSEWDGLLLPSSVNMMRDIICGEFRGGFYEIRMGHHREDLVDRLDYVLGQLDRGLEYIKQHDPESNEVILQRRKDQYRELREMLLGIQCWTEAIRTPQIIRTPHSTTIPFVY